MIPSPFNYKQAIPDATLSPSYLGGELFEVENEDYGPVFETSFESIAQTVYLRIEFVNDLADENGDRNAFFGAFSIEGPSGTTSSPNNLPEVPERYGAAGLKPMASGETALGGVVLPIELEDSGVYTLSIELRGDQFGGEPVRVMVSIDSNKGALEEFRYAEGDTWYRDMRDPGFLASEARAFGCNKRCPLWTPDLTESRR